MGADGNPNDDAAANPADAANSTSILVRRAQSGDPSGFHDLYRHLAPAVLAWANLNVPPVLRPSLDPDDLVQEVCYRALRGLAVYDPERAGFRSWLFGIAYNVLREAARSAARLPRRRPPGGAAADDSVRSRWLDAVPAATTALTQKIARDDAFRALLARLAELPDDDRHLLIYRGLEGLPLADVAALVGKPVGTVAKRWQRLREKITARVSGYDLFAPDEDEPSTPNGGA